ncbi:MAG: hypothetical protein VKK07_13270 [Merismopediaceae bacterium]|nr:hypothetical protein [Merismopediaceae bacterium]
MVVLTRFSSPILAETSASSSRPASLDAPSPLLLGSVGLSAFLLLCCLWQQWRLLQQRRAIATLQRVNQSLEAEKQSIEHQYEQEQNRTDLKDAYNLSLDYLRMRMDEEVFHYNVMNQIRNSISEMIAVSLRAETPEEGNLYLAQTLNITYDFETYEGEWRPAVLFRLKVRLSQFPLQSTSSTINQLLECIKVFVSHSTQQPSWQADLQGCAINISWDESQKPIPLLCLEQGELKSLTQSRRLMIRNTPKVLA